jgi:16S rRNA (uracil1498-N3)-methyltransferase
MARIFVPPEKLLGEHATLDAAAHRHLVKVLRLAPGAAIHLFDGAGTEVEAIIEALDKDSVKVALGSRRLIPAPACDITLLQCLARGERLDLVVQKTTELGVARIVPVQSERAMVKPTANQHRRWQTIAEEAARQSGRADVPQILKCVGLGAALDLAMPPSRFVLWEREHGKSLSQALASGPRSVVLLVGPEGGFSPKELDLATRADFLPVGLGPRILRTETAAIVAVALAQAAAGGMA